MRTGRGFPLGTNAATHVQKLAVGRLERDTPPSRRAARGGGNVNASADRPEVANHCPSGPGRLRQAREAASCAERRRVLLPGARAVVFNEDLTRFITF